MIIIEFLGISGSGSVSIPWGYNFTSSFIPSFRSSNLSTVTLNNFSPSAVNFTASSANNVNAIAVGIGF
jgi:hypothetical protein